jgi:hypothetical protein
MWYEYKLDVKGGKSITVIAIQVKCADSFQLPSILHKWWNSNIKGIYLFFEELDGPAVSALGVLSRMLSNVGRPSDGWPKICYLKLLRALKGPLSRWSRLYLQLLAPTNPWVFTTFIESQNLYHTCMYDFIFTEYVCTYHAVYLRRACRGISEIPPRRPFY